MNLELIRKQAEGALRNRYLPLRVVWLNGTRCRIYDGPRSRIGMLCFGIDRHYLLILEDMITIELTAHRPR